jgi:hyaluronan synthase
MRENPPVATGETESVSAVKNEVTVLTDTAQTAALRVLLSLGSPVTTGEGSHHDARARFRAGGVRLGRPHAGPRLRAADLLAPRQVTPGALSYHYDIPRVSYQPQLRPLLLALAAAATCLWVVAHGDFVAVHHAYLALLPLWVPTFAMSAAPLFLAWADRPYRVTARQARQLDELRVVVAVPVYNEDPGLLDRCLWSLANSSHPPDAIHVVEDGPSMDYSVLEEHWTAQHPAIRWTALPQNVGKKRAQSVAFTSHPEADIFITVDSDTTLEHRAIEEGLKPFADPGVASVAGVEEIYNKRVNWLTMAAAARNTYSQLVSWAAQSVFGDVLINRGTFALYRAEVIREIVPAYVNETFLGRPIRLGDDSMLTLFSRARGRTVQQVTAFSLPMYPETLSHHLRQWTRWSRGGSIRNYWRTKYLPLTSWGWWWTVLSLYYTIASLAVPVLLAATWPQSRRVLADLGLSVILWAYSVSPHVLRIRREGESAWQRALTMLIYPAGLLWSTYCLRPVRFYGIVTCLRQGWVTRQQGVEITEDGVRR